MSSIPRLIAGAQRFACAALVLAFVATAPSRAQESDEGARVAGEVLALFQQRCAECHGPQLAKPKGKFGYLLDLPRVAANPDYVVAGEPGESELYLTCSDGEMPPKEERERFPLLNESELALLSRWIELGAPPPPASATASAQESAGPAAGAGPEPKEPSLAELSPEKIAGRAHRLLIHFPIALLLAALFAEFLYLVTRKREMGYAAGFCVALGALGAAITSTTGWFLAEEQVVGASDRAALFLHRWGGIAVAAVSLLAALSLLHARRREGSRWPYRCLLLIAVVGLVLVGYYGGLLSHSDQHLPSPVELPFEEWVKPWAG